MKKIRYILYLFLFLILIFLDQLSKILVLKKLKQSINVVPKILNFTYVENRGVAFGFLQNKDIVIVILALIIITVILFLSVKIEKHLICADNKKKFYLIQILFIFISSGAISNMADRLRLGFVVDFLEFDFIEFPVFNIADCYVVVATFILMIVFTFFISDKELDSIFKNKQ
ncbi:signal peptidase II [Lachnospiraceae bacterium RM5]|nr:signal peptidase II [Lachnospiraceae bacterium RM5]